MSDIAIRVDSLGKQYRIGGKQEGYRTLRDTLTETFVSPFRRARKLLRGHAYGAAELDETIWALKDVSLEVKRGEVVGIIGRNGAGKTTLLKILSRITEPTEGQAEIRGRVGSLLEVGTGFHPELTGRENIYLNGAILGMRKAEIERKFDEIVDFAEIEKFVDTPVKHYSSGMYVRLAFAVAAHLEPEILLVDEVLAVGDAAFQKKCLAKMGNIAMGGRTVLFVSHNMGAIQNLCGTVVLLDAGEVVSNGPTMRVISSYIELIQGEPKSPLDDRLDRKGDGALRFTKFYSISSTGGQTDTISTGENITFVIHYETAKAEPLKNVTVSIPFYNHMGQYMFMCWTRLTGQDFEEISSSGRFEAYIPKFSLMPGRYTVNIYCEVNGILADWITEAASINVIGGDFFATGYLSPDAHGGMLVEHEWRCKPDNLTED